MSQWEIWVYHEAFRDSNRVIIVIRTDISLSSCVYCPVRTHKAAQWPTLRTKATLAYTESRTWGEGVKISQHFASYGDQTRGIQYGTAVVRALALYAHPHPKFAPPFVVRCFQWPETWQTGEKTGQKWAKTKMLTVWWWYTGVSTVLRYHLTQFRVLFRRNSQWPRRGLAKNCYMKVRFVLANKPHWRAELFRSRLLNVNPAQTILY